MSHDSLFVKECIDKLFIDHIKDIFCNVIFWSDNACHFRSAELMNHILFQLPVTYSNIEFSMNYFIEYHGKTALDRNFGLLQKANNKISEKERKNWDIELLNSLKSDGIIYRKTNVY